MIIWYVEKPNFMALTFIQLLYPQTQLNELCSLLDCDFFLCLDQSLSMDDHLSFNGFDVFNMRLYLLTEELFNITYKNVLRVHLPSCQFRMLQLDVRNDVQPSSHFLYLP